MFAFMCSMGLWKARSAIGTKASGPSLTKPSWLSQRDQPTTLHTLLKPSTTGIPRKARDGKRKANEKAQSGDPYFLGQARIHSY
jgi:hypothetical protein